MKEYIRTPHQNKVDEFMKLAGQEVPVLPKDPDEATRILRAKLIMEEALETCIKGLGVTPYVAGGHAVEEDGCTFQITGPFDMVETVDGCCDIKVVTTGTLTACGVADMAHQAEVDSNNLAKFGPGGYRRDDGKWVKPPGHQPPDIAGILKRQGYRQGEEAADAGTEEVSTAAE